MKTTPFVVIDGGEGVGKSTQIRLLNDHFKNRVEVTREPGGTPLAESVRRLLGTDHGLPISPETEFALFWGSRADHVNNRIKPALLAGKMVVSDRFDSSTFAYQIHGRQMKKFKKFFWQARSFFLADVVPDLYIYFDMDAQAGLERVACRSDTGDALKNFDNEELEFHRRLRVGFTEFFERVPHVVIDADRSKKEVFADLLSILDDHFGWRKEQTA